MLWGLERSDLRGYKMWSDPEPFIAFVPLGLTGRLVPKIWDSSGGGGCGSIDDRHDFPSAGSQPVHWTMGDFVRRMATNLLNRASGEGVSAASPAVESAAAESSSSSSAAAAAAAAAAAES